MGYFQYGVLLPRSPFGHVDQSIGKNTAAGNLGLIEPNVYINQPFEKMTVDGVEMEFQNTPGTEAPAEMNTYFPQMKAFWAACPTPASSPPMNPPIAPAIAPAGPAIIPPASAPTPAVARLPPMRAATP